MFCRLFSLLISLHCKNVPLQAKRLHMAMNVCGAVNYFRMIQVGSLPAPWFPLANQLHYHYCLGCNQKELFIQGKGEGYTIVCLFYLTKLISPCYQVLDRAIDLSHQKYIRYSCFKYHSLLTCHANLTQPTSVLKMGQWPTNRIVLFPEFFTTWREKIVWSRTSFVFISCTTKIRMQIA